MEDGDQIDAFLEQVGALLWMSTVHSNMKFSWVAQPVAVVINHLYHDPPSTNSGHTSHIIFLFHARSLFCILVGLFNANNFSVAYCHITCLRLNELMSQSRASHVTFKKELTSSLFHSRLHKIPRFK